MFENLVRKVAPLDMGGWRMNEVERATSALGWELMEPEELNGRVRQKRPCRASLVRGLTIGTEPIKLSPKPVRLCWLTRIGGSGS